MGGSVVGVMVPGVCKNKDDQRERLGVRDVLNWG